MTKLAQKLSWKLLHTPLDRLKNHSKLRLCIDKECIAIAKNLPIISFRAHSLEKPLTDNNSQCYMICFGMAPSKVWSKWMLNFASGRAEFKESKKFDVPSFAKKDCLTKSFDATCNFWVKNAIFGDFLKDFNARSTLLPLPQLLRIWTPEALLEQIKSSLATQ